MTGSPRYLSLEDALAVAEEISGGVRPELRDLGLLDAAVHRPQASMFGEDAYPSLVEKAAALMHSIVCNHALVDGNKRLGLSATLVFLRLNGADPQPDDEDAYALTMAVAEGKLDVPEIATVIRGWLGEVDH